MTEEDDFGDLYSNKASSSSSAAAAAFPSLQSLGSLFRLLEDDPNDFKQGGIFSAEKIEAPPVVAEQGAGLERKGTDTGSEDDVCNAGGGLERKGADTGSEDDVCNADGGLERKDVDTDSEDDIEIVLEPLDQSTRRETNGKHTDEDSEDGEDFVILTDNKPVNACYERFVREDKESLGKFKHNPILDGKGRNENFFGGHKGARQIGYSSQGYQWNYQYARSTAYGRAMPLKHRNVQGDWTASGRGLMRFQRMSLPPRGNNTTGGYTNGLEYSLPSKKTIFDIDIESLEEKPWRHPCADTSDYFNYGFDESSWKEYCNKLAQFRSESSNSKIEVYESGSAAQEFDPDLPLELSMVASNGRLTSDGIPEKTYFQGYPLAHATQVDGGLWEPHSSVDSRGGLTRESDAISLIDVVSLKEESVSDDHCPEENGIASKTAHDISPRSQLDFCKSTRESIKSEIMFTAESQAYFFRHIIPSPATRLGKIPVQEKGETKRSYNTSLNYGQVLQENQNNGSHKCVDERRKNQVSNICKERKSCKKIDGNKGGFSSLLLRKCKNRGHDLGKWNQSHHQDISPVEMPVQCSTGLVASGLILESERRQKKKFRGSDGVLDHDLNRDTFVKKSFTCAVEEVVNYSKFPLEVNGGKRKALVKNKFEPNKMIKKASFELNNMQDFPWGDSGDRQKKNNDVKRVKQREKRELKNESICGNLQQSQVKTNHRIVINGNQGTRHKLVKCVISKDKRNNRDIANTSMGIVKNRYESDNMFSEREKLPIQFLETEVKLDSRDGSYLSVHNRNNILRKHTSVVGTSKHDAIQVGFSTAKRVYTKKLMGSLKLLQTLKKSREKNSLLQQRASLHSGNKPHFHIFGKQTDDIVSMQAPSGQGRDLYSASKGKVCGELPKEMEGKADCLTYGEGLSLFNSKKQRALKQLPKLKYAYVEQKQHRTNTRRRERGKVKLLQSDATDLGYDRNEGCSEPVNEMKKGNTTVEAGKDRNIASSGSVDDWKNKKEDHNCKHDPMNTQSDNVTLKVPDVAPHEILLDGKGHTIFNIDKTEQSHRASDNLSLHQENLLGTMRESSEDESNHRGRSKFERWTSHSEQVMEDISQGMITGGNRISFSKKARVGTSNSYIGDADASPIEGNSNEQMTRAQKSGKKWKRNKNIAAHEKGTFNNTGDDKQTVISELIEKFGRRRERFQEPMVEQDPSLTLANDHVSNLAVEMKAERPRRKRRWGGG